MAVQAEEIERLRAAALKQPGAVERQSGVIKFACPQCRAEGHDEHRDNAGLFSSGKFGCAFAPQDPKHWEAIKHTLYNGMPDNGPSVGTEPSTESRITSAGIADVLAADPGALETKYIVTPWLPRGGLGILASKWGVGKGKLGQDLCLARASGGRWLGLPVEAGPALFWSGEQGQREDFRVTQALCRGRGLTSAEQFPYHFEIIYDPPVRFGHPTMFAYVRARVREHPGLLVIVDSHRRAFEGDESDSAAADTFYRTVLIPLRAEGATVLTLAHPPKTGGQQKVIADENMVRGSGDWVAQLDSFLVLRPVNRERTGPATEILTMRLLHVKPRSGPQANPLLVHMAVTHDLTPEVTFTLTAEASRDDGTAADLAGAVKEAAKIFEEKKRLGRAGAIKILETAGYSRDTAREAVKRLVELGVIHGPLASTKKRKGERGHWYIFVKPLPAPEAATATATPPQDEADPEEGEWIA